MIEGRGEETLIELCLLPLFGLQDLLLERADDRVLLHGALPGHLPPALLAHHVRVQEGRQDHRYGELGKSNGPHNTVKLRHY